MTTKRNPYVRIMEAAQKGVGVRLSARDVFYLSQDGAIAAVASNTLSDIPVSNGGYRVTLEGFQDTDTLTIDT